MPIEIFWTIVGLVITNAVVWAFIVGRWKGTTNQRLDDLEDPQILPECQVLFNEINNKLGKVEGSTEAILNVLKTNAKEGERKKIRNRK